MRHTAEEWKRGVCSSKRAPEEQHEAGRDAAGSIGVSGGHERRGQRSGNDGTEDQGVREAREHRHSGVPQGRHCDSPDGRGTNENALHHECAQVDGVPGLKAEVTNVEQAQRAVVTKVWTRSRRDRPKELPNVLETAKSLRSCAGTAKRKATERQSAARDTKVSARENRQVRRKAMATVLEKARNGSKANVLGGEKSGHISKDCRSSETNAFEADEDEPSSETGCFEHGEHQSSMHWRSGQYKCQKETASFAVESTHVQQ